MSIPLIVKGLKLNAVLTKVTRKSFNVFITELFSVSIHLWAIGRSAETSGTERMCHIMVSVWSAKTLNWTGPTLGLASKGENNMNLHIPTLQCGQPVCTDIFLVVQRNADACTDPRWSLEFSGLELRLSLSALRVRRPQSHPESPETPANSLIAKAGPRLHPAIPRWLAIQFGNPRVSGKLAVRPGTNYFSRTQCSRGLAPALRRFKAGMCAGQGCPVRPLSVSILLRAPTLWWGFEALQVWRNQSWNTKKRSFQLWNFQSPDGAPLCSDVPLLSAPELWAPSCHPRAPSPHPPAEAPSSRWFTAINMRFILLPHPPAFVDEREREKRKTSLLCLFRGGGDERTEWVDCGPRRATMSSRAGWRRCSGTERNGAGT